MTPLIGLGLSLLPKIPEIWDSVAGLFGKETPKIVEDAAKLRDEIVDDISSGKVEPEKMVELKKLLYDHQEEMAKIALDEKKLEFEEKKLDYDDMKGVRELEMRSYESDDQFVKRTRPMILRKLFTLCAAYALYAPLCIIAISGMGVIASTVTSVISIVEWIGGWLFGTFTTAYLGYAAARTVDKRHPGLKDKKGLLGKATKNLLKIGM